MRSSTISCAAVLGVAQQYYQLCSSTRVAQQYSVAQQYYQLRSSTSLFVVVDDLPAVAVGADVVVRDGGLDVVDLRGVLDDAAVDLVPVVRDVTVFDDSVVDVPSLSYF